MRAYDEAYLDEVRENQGKLFDLFLSLNPDCSTADFIERYMGSETRKAIDKGQAYVSTMDYHELYDYFLFHEGYSMKKGKDLDGFLPRWIGEFYAYYQWFYDIPSAMLTKRIPIAFLVKAYPGLHDLDLDLVIKKVGEGK